MIEGIPQLTLTYVLEYLFMTVICSKKFFVFHLISVCVSTYYRFCSVSGLVFCYFISYDAVYGVSRITPSVFFDVLYLLNVIYLHFYCTGQAR